MFHVAAGVGADDLSGDDRDGRDLLRVHRLERHRAGAAGFCAPSATQPGGHLAGDDGDGLAVMPERHPAGELLHDGLLSGRRRKWPRTARGVRNPEKPPVLVAAVIAIVVLLGGGHQVMPSLF